LKFYPNQYFEYLDGGDAKKYVFLGNQRLVIIDNEDVYFNFSDHLNSSSVTTNENGDITNLIDYFPYGSNRVDIQLDNFIPIYQFTDKELDSESSLNYYGSRYYDSQIGKFIQSDPVSLVLTDEEELKKKSGQNPESILTNPQTLNVYSYTANNPVKYVDPDGNFFWFAAALAAYAIANTVWDLGNVGLSAYYFSKDQSSENAAYLAGDLTALSSPIMFGGLGVYNKIKNYKQNQQVSKLNKVNKVIKFRHVSDRNYSEIIKEGFNSNRKIYTLNMDDSNSKYASNIYNIDRSNGPDYGIIDIEIPTNVFKDLESKGLVGYEQKYIKNIGEYKDIYFLPEAASIVNKYIVK